MPATALALFGAVLTKELRVLDGNLQTAQPTHTIPEGVVTLERIENPQGRHPQWLVIKGTPFGMAEVAWTDLARKADSGVTLTAFCPET
jgi:hypothetical protein